jgi:hypothetical protein
MEWSPIQRAVFEAARRLGHGWIGPEHGVIVIAAGPGGDPARRALEAAGFDGAAFEGRFAQRVERHRVGTGDDDREQELSPNPAWYGIWGRAEGFAGALGTGTVRPSDLLLALLWDTRDWLFTREAGVSREAIFDALADVGVRLPDRPMPDLDREWVNPRRADFPDGG